MKAEGQASAVSFPIHYTEGLAHRTKSGYVVKNFEFYRCINRDNLWNDSYHASRRTWHAYHRKQKPGLVRSGHSIDAVEKNKRDSALRLKFIQSTRSDTQSRFQAQRALNQRRWSAANFIPHARLAHRRQDVCSGQTAPIGGDLRDLPYKAVRCSLTRTLESMDGDAMKRLRERLEFEKSEDERQLQQRASRRAELLMDVKERQKYFDLLEKQSGLPPRQTRAQTVPPRSPDRLVELARPRLRRYAGVNECQDALNLVHVQSPEIFKALHVSV